MLGLRRGDENLGDVWCPKENPESLANVRFLAICPKSGQSMDLVFVRNSSVDKEGLFKLSAFKDHWILCFCMCVGSLISRHATIYCIRFHTQITAKPV